MTEPIRNPKIVALLIDRATVGLTPDEQHELDSLLSSADLVDDFSFDSIVASLQNSAIEADLKPLPDHLRTRVLNDAKRVISSKVAAPPSQHFPVELDDAEHELDPMLVPRQRQRSAGTASRREVLAWLTAAASLLLAAFSWFNSRKVIEPALAAQSDQRDLNRFLADMNPDELLMVELAPGNHSSGGKAKGTVYWNRQSGHGYVKVSDVVPNQPSKQQYQLWVIDRVRGIEDRPNAGVFDIPSEGDHVFAFRSELKVFDAQGFAITVEKPGGINKSDLSKIALVNLGS